MRSWVMECGCGSGVAVAAFVGEGQVGGRAARGGRSRSRPARRGRARGASVRELASQLRRVAVWRVEEDEIVWRRRPRCVAEDARGVRAGATSAASAPSAARFAPRSPLMRRRRASTNVAARGAARERLEPERAGPGEQVEHARRRRAGRGSRTAPRARGRCRARVALPARRRAGAGRRSVRRRSSCRERRRRQVERARRP